MRFLEIHATRGGSGDEYNATLNWAISPNNQARDSSGRALGYGASYNYVIGRSGALGTVLDDDRQPTYSAGYGGAGSTWSIDEYGVSFEFAQARITEPFTDAQYATGAREFAARCIRYGIPVVMLDADPQAGPVPVGGFVRHDRCANGRKLGKSDPGPLFDDNRFLAAVRQEIDQQTGRGTDMPDVIIQAGTRVAQIGVAGKHRIGLQAHADALIKGGARVVAVDDATFDAIPDVRDVTGGGAAIDIEAITGRLDAIERALVSGGVDENQLAGTVARILGADLAKAIVKAAADKLGAK